MVSGASHFQSAWARAPMLRLSLPFVVGIASAMWWPLSLKVVSVVLVVVTLLAAWLLLRKAHYVGRWSRGSAAQLWFFAFGLCWQVVRDPLSRPTHASLDGGERVQWIIRVTAINGVSEKVVRADGQVLALYHLDGVVPRTGSVMLTLMRKEGVRDPIAGDELVLDSRIVAITRIPDPGGFDRRAWAASRGMYHEAFAGPEDWWVLGHVWRWTDLFEPTRQRVAAWLTESGLPFRERALVKALVLGLRDELDHEQKDAFVKSGTIHVLAVSGTHVGFIYAMLLFMFGWLGGGPKARVGRGLVILLALWSYAGLTGACPSVLRATIMFSLFTLAGMGARRADALNSLFAAALLLLLWDPHMLIEIGFQLSFLAVLGIILFYSPLLRLWVPNNRYVGHIWSLMVMSIAAQVLTTPLSLYLFKAFPVWFLPANLIVVTAAGIAVYASVALLVFFRLPYLGPGLVFLLTLLLWIVDKVTAFFASLPYAYPPIRASISDMLLLYAITMLIALLLMWRWRPAVRLSVLLVVVLLASWGHRAHTAQDRVSFTIYDDRHTAQASMRVGRTLTLLNNAGSNDLDPWLARKAERHERALGLTDRGHVGLDALHSPVVSEVGSTVYGAGRWSAPGMVVHFHREGTEIPEALHTDVLVISASRYISEEELEKIASRARHVVLAGGLPWKLRSFLRRWCTGRGVPCHDVREQGAFVLEGKAV